MTRYRVAAVVLMLALAGGAAPLGAHDVFRFVGTVIKWDPKKQAIDIRTIEEWDGKVGQYTRHLVLRAECRVMRWSSEVKRSELKAGLLVVVDAAGVDITDLEAVEIEIRVPVPPAKKEK